mmetsp:Transcript_22439/g.49028  ORF Transcript_22439/g.49028 Transcript_22439/m.49028 type:complete len:583 (-) Transcript_22439:411-2159(-)
MAASYASTGIRGLNQTVLAPARSSVAKSTRSLQASPVSFASSPKPATVNRALSASKGFLTARNKGQYILHAVRADAPSDSVDAAALRLIAEVTKQVDEALVVAVQESAEAAQQSRPVSDSTLRKQVQQAIGQLSRGLLERDTEVRLLLLAALAGEHLLLLGPPGTAKSELSRRLNKLVGGTYFERLLTRFSVPEELFGPLSMRGLENDQYVRQVDGYLPTAEVAFVDEIFKANSAILNALLTLLNERLFDNGNQRLPVPLLTVVGASNELPESEELDALYDRFLIRRTVSQVSNNQLHKLARLAAGRGASLDSEAAHQVSALTIDEFRDTAGAAYEAVDVPDGVIDILTNLRNYLQDKCEPPIYVSDRRFMKAVQLLQVVAHGDGREEVTEYDCLLLEHVFGNRPDDSHKVRAHVLETIASDPGLQQAELVFLGLFGRACRLLGAAGAQGGSAEEVPEAVQEAATLATLLRARHAALAAALDGGFPELKSSIWQSEDSVRSAVQALTPQMTENKKKAEELLREALVLQTCLERGLVSIRAGQSSQFAGSLLERLLPKRFKQYERGIAGAAAAPGAPAAGSAK